MKRQDLKSKLSHWYLWFTIRLSKSSSNSFINNPKTRNKMIYKKEIDVKMLNFEENQTHNEGITLLTQPKLEKSITKSRKIGRKSMTNNDIKISECLQMWSSVRKKHTNDFENSQIDSQLSNNDSLTTVVYNGMTAKETYHRASKTFVVDLTKNVRYFWTDF